MGNYNNTLNSLDEFSSLPDSIYLNAYTTEEKYLNNDLQHAMIETNNLFNDSLSYFVTQQNPWFVRPILFSYGNSTGENDESIGSRTVLSIK